MKEIRSDQAKFDMHIPNKLVRAFDVLVILHYTF